MTRCLAHFDPIHFGPNKFGFGRVLTHFGPPKFNPTRSIVTPKHVQLSFLTVLPSHFISKDTFFLCPLDPHVSVKKLSVLLSWPPTLAHSVLLYKHLCSHLLVLALHQLHISQLFCLYLSFLPPTHLVSWDTSYIIFLFLRIFTNSMDFPISDPMFCSPNLSIHALWTQWPPLTSAPPWEYDPSLSSRTKDTKAEETNQGSNIPTRNYRHNQQDNTSR